MDVYILPSHVYFRWGVALIGNNESCNRNLVSGLFQCSVNIFRKPCIVCINFIETIGVEEFKKKNYPRKFGASQLGIKAQVNDYLGARWGIHQCFRILAYHS